MCGQKFHALEKHQQVPETAQLWAVVMKFEKAGAPPFVTLAKHLLGNTFKVVKETLLKSSNCTSLHESNLPAQQVPPRHMVKLAKSQVLQWQDLTWAWISHCEGVHLQIFLEFPDFGFHLQVSCEIDP
jgi:hypothetical protein